MRDSFPQSSALPGCATFRTEETPIVSMFWMQAKKTAGRTKVEKSLSVALLETEIHTENATDVHRAFRGNRHENCPLGKLGVSPKSQCDSCKTLEIGRTPFQWLAGKM